MDEKVNETCGRAGRSMIKVTYTLHQKESMLVVVVRISWSTLRASVWDITASTKWSLRLVQAPARQHSSLHSVRAASLPHFFNPQSLAFSELLPLWEQQSFSRRSLHCSARHLTHSYHTFPPSKTTLETRSDCALFYLISVLPIRRWHCDQ